ncbi:MAG: ATP-grasp domain-containing protein [Patescibacteria group bacterium]|nr:ATP-grasp domain-containing protein [Patescibacteria group bacterium]
MITNKKLDAITHAGFRSLIRKAVEMDIDVHIYKKHKKLIRLSYKNKVIYTNNYMPALSRNAGSFTLSKEVTKTILNENNITVPRGITAKTFIEACSLIKKNILSYPLILKPIDGSLAQGITWNITSQKELRTAIKFFKEQQKSNYLLKRKRFVVEEMFIGDEYRVLVLKNRVISCIQKIPATIVGDGSSTIKELVDVQNEIRLPDFSIKLDTTAKTTIKHKGFTLTTILPKSYKLVLRNDMMLANGGRAVDRTHVMSDELKNRCVQATRALGLTFSGIDLLTTNIKQGNAYVIIEVNSNPVYIINEKPLVEGSGVDVSLLLLQTMFPRLKNK